MTQSATPSPQAGPSQPTAGSPDPTVAHAKAGSRSLLLAGAGWVAVLALAAVVLLQQRVVQRVADQSDALGQKVEALLGEVTRMRLEQRAEGLGPRALLDKLEHYAPALASAATPQPDYPIVKREMDAILRAFGTLGEDAWKPVLARFQELQPDTAFDQLKWLLEAAVRVDPARGKELVQNVLLGRTKPSVRLRLYAADVMLRTDRALAQRLLRQIVTTESSRGINPDRAGATGLPMLDPAAVATNGFHNFVAAYVRSEDPELETTLLMILGRKEHDAITLQECVKILGDRGCVAAVERIQELYLRPPAALESPLFQRHCADALANIQGEGARPFLEQALKQSTNDAVASHLRALLGRPLVAKDRK